MSERFAAPGHGERGQTLVAVVADGLERSRSQRELTRALGRLGIERHQLVSLAAPSRLALARSLSERPYDLVHVCGPGPLGIAALVIARSLGLPATSGYDGELDPLTGGEPEFASGPGPRGALSAFYRDCRLVLSPNRSADRSLERLGVQRDAVVRWLPGVDVELFNPGRRSREADPGRVFQILHAGRLTEDSARLLADAFQIARDRSPRLHLSLVGAGPPERWLRGALGSAATLLGELDGAPLARAYASADLLVAPATADPWVAPILEAQASGLPILAVEGDASQLIEPGRTGCLVAPEPLVLAAALRWLARRGAVRQRLASGGLVAVRQRSWQQSLRRLGEQWEFALGARSTPLPGQAGVPVPPEPALADAAPATRASPALRVVDVAIFYGERGGGIHTYLEAKAAYARRTGAFEHHLVVPGRAGTSIASNRHEQRSLQLSASNGYRIPLGSGLPATLKALAPDVVLLHDPYWTPRLACRAAHEVGAAVIAVHHSTAALHAAGLPGPQGVYTRALRRWYRRAYGDVDAVMSVIDSGIDARRSPTLRLRLGLDPAFAPPVAVEPSDHVLYVGRLSREKGLRELFEATAVAPERWPLTLLGTGPAGDTLRERARQLGIASRINFHGYVGDRAELAREYARASCVVLPGAHETFGLAALEAAACGASVVTAQCTPSAALLDGFVETFRAGDPNDLLRAIERARRRRPARAAAAALARGNGWDQALAAELADLEAFVGSA